MPTQTRARPNSMHPVAVNRTYHSTAYATQQRVSRNTTHMVAARKNTLMHVRKGTLIGFAAGSLVPVPGPSHLVGAIIGHQMSVQRNPNRIGRHGQIIGGTNYKRARARQATHRSYVAYKGSLAKSPRTARQAAASRRNLASARRHRH